MDFSKVIQRLPEPPDNLALLLKFKSKQSV